jgi:hypothetical protein
MNKRIWELGTVAVLGEFAKLRKAPIGFNMSVRPHKTFRLPFDGFSWNLVVEYFFKSVDKIQVSLKYDKNNGHFTGRHTYSFIISRSILLRMRNILNKLRRKNQNTHFMVKNVFRKSCRLWDNVENFDTARQAADYSLIQRMRIVCWVPRATNTHSEYVMLLAFPSSQRLRERASELRYTYIVCLATRHRRAKHQIC